MNSQSKVKLVAVNRGPRGMIRGSECEATGSGGVIKGYDGVARCSESKVRGSEGCEQRF